MLPVTSITSFSIKLDYTTCKDKYCYFNFTIDKPIQSSMLIFYELGGFAQNSPDYSNSFSAAQLSGNKISLEKAKKECGGKVYLKNMSAMLK